MEEVTQRSQEYSTAKNMIKGCIKDTKQNFIYIGHYLKEIRDNRLYQEDGYADFDTFMASEVSKDKGWASRCINVADQFGIMEDGQPALAEEYQEYSLSLLIEMVAMTPGQRELVTPDTEVKQAREIKKADKEKSCESQLEEPKKKDAESEPEDELSAAWFVRQWIAHCNSYFQRAMRACRIDGSMADKAKAIQVELAPNGHSGHGGDRCIFTFHGFAEGMDFRVGNEKMHLKYGRLAKELLEMFDPWDSEFDEKEAKGKQTPVQTERAPAEIKTWNTTPSSCPYNPECCSCTLNNAEKEVIGDGINCAGACCWECSFHGDCGKECNSSANREQYQEAVPEDEQETIIDVDFEEVPPAEEYTPKYFLTEQQENLNEMLKVFEGDNPCTVPHKLLERQKTIVAALTAMVSSLEQEEQLGDHKQPELPILKNNDQRAAFVDAYEIWPLWIETDETGERYYRYDLADSTSMVVKVYHAMLFDYKATGMPYENRHKEGYGRHEYYLLKEGKFFRDCETNRSALIEKLKDIQKKGKG